MTPPLVSVIVPCRNEAPYIGPCLESIVASAYPRDRLEVLVADGRSDDGTREIAESYAVRYPWIRVLDNSRRITPSALNLSIGAARGDVIVRMDAHVVYPPEYLPRLVAALQESGADNVGGCLVTLPAEETAVARAIAVGLAHPLGVGNSYFRIGTAKPRWVDTVPFGCYRRDVFERVGLFDEDLVRNQDDEFNFRLIRRGGRILLLPDVRAYYYARRSLRQVARMFYQYGYFKPLVGRKVGRLMTWRQLAPSGLVLATAGAALAGPWWQPAAWAGGSALAVYALLVIVGAVTSARRAGLKTALALLAVLPVLHVSYGIGFLRGVADHLRPAQRPRLDPASVPLSRKP